MVVEGEDEVVVVKVEEEEEREEEEEEEEDGDGNDDDDDDDKDGDNEKDEDDDDDDEQEHEEEEISPLAQWIYCKSAEQGVPRSSLARSTTYISSSIFLHKYHIKNCKIFTYIDICY